MKKTLLLAMIFGSQIVYSQYKDTSRLQFSIDSDVQFSSSSRDNSKENTAGTGTLGLKFKNNLVYGSIHFTAFSKSDSISVSDTNNIKSFGTNLLLPQNSNGSISNFNFNIGTYHLFRAFNELRSLNNNADLNSKLDDNGKFSAFDNLGLFLNINVNNNTWRIDSLSTPVSIVSTNLGIQYLLFDKEIAESNQKIKAVFFLGFTHRGVGGDYGLTNFEENRLDFLNTKRLTFGGLYMGGRLEISDFYGQINYTSFKRDLNISGFSGNQFVISLGLNADINFPVKK